MFIIKFCRWLDSNRRPLLFSKYDSKKIWLNFIDCAAPLLI